MQIGNIFFRNQNYIDALKYYYKSYDIYSKLTTGIDYHFLFIKIGDTYLKLNDYEKAKEYYEQSLSIANSTSNEKAGSYIALAKLYRDQNRYNKAIKYEGIYRIS